MTMTKNCPECSKVIQWLRVLDYLAQVYINEVKRKIAKKKESNAILKVLN